MDISGLSANNAMMTAMAQQNKSQETSLTDDQKQTLDNIISQYDPNNMTQDDKKSLFNALKSAGIGPSKEVGEALNAAGFKPPAGGPHGPDGAHHGHHHHMDGTEGQQDSSSQDSSQSVDTSTESTMVQNLLNTITSGNYSEQELNNLAQEVAQNGSSLQPGAIVTADA